MNYRIKLGDILNNDEITAVKKNTEIRAGSSLDNVTVGELRDLSDYLPDTNPPETLVSKHRPALRALAILIARATKY